MKVENLILTNIHKDSFRPDKSAKVINIVMVTPEPGRPRMCYQVQYPDGTVDYTPIEDYTHYKVGTDD